MNDAKLTREMQYKGVKQLARRLGCSREHLSRVLHGHLKPNARLAGKMARLGITPGAL